MTIFTQSITLALLFLFDTSRGTGLITFYPQEQHVLAFNSLITADFTVLAVYIYTVSGKKVPLYFCL